ncbi:mandelate racemase/muconate lactonizing enzyme family protein [Paracoccus onubensis]|uniref:mandelate racemase/muconate lactonizing enzyme family protein n=1 Tax=Paracoccus onubensis TaxID=1675788 RepID=UPI002731E871|nr:mandelate racemase/muconate lactonizing enzyme family protein [Paracoccus onubensis]MDP0926270.1 mandelate racemase/muconate lactonizing enzyme family protein [Paracoccus onubensis]
MPFRIARIQAWSLRVPVRTPVATSFGVMHNRPAVFLRIEDADGAAGWGEVFANWPAAGAEHRVNLLIDDIADLVLGREWNDPAEMFGELSRATHIRALQCGEPGPFRQVIAGLDIAAWDMAARRNGLPLAKLLSSEAADRVPVYASGIHIDAAAAAIAAARAAGFRGFKVKVGFDRTVDPAKVIECSRQLLPGENLYADANQAWTSEEARHFLLAVTEAGLGWVEEPIACDAPDGDWIDLARLNVPLAAGENIAGTDDFDHALSLGALRFVQPDVCKWGGVSGNFAVARDALRRGHIYCPHFLGGGIGLVASAHVLAAAGGPGLLEVDVNPNPLRDALASSGDFVRDGHWHLSPRPGLGIDDIPAELHDHVTLLRETG